MAQEIRERHFRDFQKGAFHAEENCTVRKRSVVLSRKGNSMGSKPEYRYLNTGEWVDSTCRRDEKTHALFWYLNEKQVNLLEA